MLMMKVKTARTLPKFQRVERVIQFMVRYGDALNIRLDQISVVAGLQKLARVRRLPFSNRDKFSKLDEIPSWATSTACSSPWFS
jgi:hypothetical protein